MHYKGLKEKYWRLLLSPLVNLVIENNYNTWYIVGLQEGIVHQHYPGHSK